MGMTGRDVAAARRTLGLTRAAFAAKLGVSRISVWRWETEAVRVTDAVANHVRLLVQTAPRPRRRKGPPCR
jgi:DNA-binding transcriptional regulator YiaG